MGDLDSAELAERLRRALEPQQVISALRNLGISTEDFELVTGADQRTVRRWADGSEPRSQAADAIDRLRVAVLYLLQRNAMAPQEIPHWLRRRNLELDLDADLGVRRPLDAIRDDRSPTSWRRSTRFCAPSTATAPSESPSSCARPRSQRRLARPNAPMLSRQPIGRRSAWKRTPSAMTNRHRCPQAGKPDVRRRRTRARA